MMRIVLHSVDRDLKGAPRARTQTSPSDRVSCRHHRGTGYACLPVLGAVYVSLYAADARPHAAHRRDGVRRRHGDRRTAELFPPDVRPSRTVLRASGGGAQYRGYPCGAFFVRQGCCRARRPRDGRACRGPRPDDSHVRFKVEAIALDDKDVASLATAMQQRIEEACDTMLGAPGTTARVRFLPSKTTVQTVEVSGE